jgi:diguanylate cyclase (GGDEF)-like protein
VSVVAETPWLSNRHNLLLLIIGLAVVLFAVGARGWFVERNVRRKTASLGYVERRRSRILEDINNSRPLAAIMEQITELVSFMLKGAPCWCQIADGAQLGNCPPKLEAFRIVQQEIPARSGHSLGTIFAALDPLTEPQPAETEALAMATALSALAIETRRLYTDLRRRSEFDRQLDALTTEARLSAGIFGLIYIDLNRFKQVNDVYGHHVGDLYLSEVSRRMKRQLRSVDTLARLGGDEFAALVPVVHSRSDVEEIAERLEHSFDEHFQIEGFTIQGSASVGISIYPEDGTTKDALLNCADAAMYMEKNAGR